MAKKILYSLISIILAAAIVFMGCFFGIPQFNEWVKNAFKSGDEIVQPDDSNPDKGDTPDTPDTPITGEKVADSLFQVTPIDPNNKLMRIASVASIEDYGLSTQAENATYTLTASVDPFETTDQTISWSMEWANSSSAWASGKNVADYVTLNIPEEGAKTVTLLPKQAFGERIRVIATSNSNPDVTAYCVLDYAKRVTGVNGTLGSDLSIGFNGGSADSFTYKCSVTSGVIENGGQIGTFIGLTYGVGTYNDTFTYSFTYRPELAFLNGAYGLNTVDYGVSITPSGEFTSPISGGRFGYGRYFLLTGISDNSSWGFADTFANTGVRYLMSNPNVAIGTVTVQATGAYSNFTKTYFVYADTASLTTVATSLNLSDSNIIM